MILICENTKRNNWSKSTLVFYESKSMCGNVHSFVYKQKHILLQKIC